eukprot:GFYU01008184.1.p1 GENE.GFYU01008184.1~~GFYU01008184.1.p1  ORF type:complete len:364 (+),score=31.18 GFYU01008184.1:80-1171(+)
MGCCTAICATWDSLVDIIIRPPRSLYDEDNDLGYPWFKVDDYPIARKDFTLTNNRDQKLQCSWWQLDETKRSEKEKNTPRPVVVYCHGNSGSRCDALTACSVLLRHGITVFGFDFSGSGYSDGEYVGLGYYEVDDLIDVVRYLEGQKTVSCIGLWGRSMGATTSLLYLSTAPSIKACVFDSPFSSLPALCKEAAGHVVNTSIPCVECCAICCLRRSAMKRAQVDISMIDTRALFYSPNSVYPPAVFGHGKSDNIVAPWHSEWLHANYKSADADKKRVVFDGDHNSARSTSFKMAACRLFLHHLLDMEWKEISNDPEELGCDDHGEFDVYKSILGDQVQTPSTGRRGSSPPRSGRMSRSEGTRI